MSVFDSAVLGIWFATLGEYLLVRFLVAPAYGFGLPIWRERTNLPKPPGPYDRVFETTLGDFLVVSDALCIFRRRDDWLRFYTPMDVRCRIRWNTDGAVAEARVSYPVLVWFACWLVSAILSHENLFVAAGFVALLVIAPIPLERSRAKRMLAEYAAACFPGGA